MTTPKPNQAVRGSSSGVAIMAVFDLLGRKWNMRILWELRSEPLSFRALQERCDGMSPSVLNTRIKQLSEAQLVVTTTQGYQLTSLGLTLMETLDPLRAWAKEWEAQLSHSQE
ncbi:HxlR family transcriptional regulator [Vibrio cidicii]|jgi:DNA-binding HxlR family transcriptional regulator|uniref:HxlR family transcriptional regulator n=1 Tax=Vibrio cidicii TaxID=1763883 RepID=A0ABR5W7A8_9VIBR|nr:helix-turn-helix domain-containing protein [Vibrio cidicii]KYN79743.1 HxlR family transcriptional regulator [Vibrio cidicii]KYN91090.1 HxlR family transcriptional regulator [Vibrio cidicii]MBG0759826.1 transcriptional regulator [Vibrio cidicii]